MSADPEHAALVATSARRSDFEANRERILRGAASVLPGDPSASMSVIAAAGVHRATLHRHFPSREALLLAMNRRHLEELTARLDQWDGAEPLDLATLTDLSTDLAEIVIFWKPSAYLPIYPPELRESSHALRVAGQRIMKAARRTPGMLRTDRTVEELRRAWLTPLVYASDGVSDAQTICGFMLAAVCRSS